MTIRINFNKEQYHILKITVYSNEVIHGDCVVAFTDDMKNILKS